MTKGTRSRTEIQRIENLEEYLDPRAQKKGKKLNKNSLRLKQIRSIKEWYEYWSFVEDYEFSRDELMEYLMKSEQLRQEVGTFPKKVQLLDEILELDDFHGMGIVLLSELLEIQSMTRAEIQALEKYSEIIVRGLRIVDENDILQFMSALNILQQMKQQGIGWTKQMNQILDEVNAFHKLIQSIRQNEKIWLK